MKDIVFCSGRFGYRPLPKVASTSIKALLYEIEEGEPFCPKRVGMHVHTFMNKKKHGDLSVCEKTFVIVRDPIERLLSAYKNRVLYHKELSEPFIREKFPEQYWSLPHFTPGLGQFIEHFELFLSVAPIYHHCRPVVDFFGGETLEDFTYIYRMEELDSFVAEISKLLGKPVALKHSQSGGRKYLLRDLSKQQLEKLIEFYREDYELVGDFYSVDEVWRKWHGDKHSIVVPHAAPNKMKTRQAKPKKNAGAKKGKNSVRAAVNKIKSSFFGE